MQVRSTGCYKILAALSFMGDYGRLVLSNRRLFARPLSATERGSRRRSLARHRRPSQKPDPQEGLEELVGRARACRFPQNSLFSDDKTTNFSLRRGPRAVSHTPLGRPWGPIGLPEFPKEAFGGSKCSKSCLNLGQCLVPGGRFRGFLAFGTNWRTKREP